MPRKTLAELDSALVTAATEEFAALSAVRYEMAVDLYDLQDAKTKEAIDSIVLTLRENADGDVALRVGGSSVQVKLDDEVLTHNLLWLAVEIMKDLALVDIQVANFEFAANLCASCGDEV